MAKVVSPLICRVEVIGKAKPSTYESGSFYHPTLFLDENQPEGAESSKIWKNLTAEEVSQLKKGDRVQLVPVGQDKAGKPKHNIILIGNPSPATVPPTPPHPALAAELSPEQKRAIAAFIEQQAGLFNFCLATVQNKVPGVPPGEECAIASLLFQSAQKRFGL